MKDNQQKLTIGIFPLLNWFHDNARILPWRSEPTPYRVWVSEIMLQQTRVAAVLGYFARFMEALPTVCDLANAEEDTLLKLWQGLGYYNRARNLQKAAQLIETRWGGVFPNTYEELLTLPGVGDYTAGAIASIAFGVPVPAVDGNVLRVLARLTGDDSDIAAADTKKRVRELLLAVMPTDFPGNYNQALMELGATVCLPNGAPLCAQCPWQDICTAHLEERTAALPVKSAKKARRIENRTVFLLLHDGRIALRRRPAKGLLARLWEFPNELNGVLPFEAWGIVPVSVEDGGKSKHIFTHIEWHMTHFIAQTASPILPSGWVWATAEELETVYTVPNAFSAALNLALERLP